MLQPIRIGKDISIEWAILTNGIAVSLEGRKLSLEITTPVMKKTYLPITITQNIIRAKYPAREQKSVGVYSLTLWENKGREGQTCVDRCKAFKLVSKTCQEPSCDIEDEPCVTLCGNLFVGVRGESAYEIALRHGYLGSEEEWLKSLGYHRPETLPPSEEGVHIDLTPEQMIELQKPASQAALALSYLAKKIICIIEKSESVVDDVVNFGSRLEKVENNIFPITLSVTGAGLYEIGTSTDITLSWSLTKGESILDPEMVTVNDVPVEGNSKTFKSVSKDTSYVISAVYEGKTYTVTKNVLFVLPVRFGFSDQNSASSLSVESLEKSDLNGDFKKEYVLQNPVTGNYLWFLLPENFDIKGIYSSGILFPFEDYETKTYKGLIYKCYRSSSPLNEGDIHVTIV